MPRSTNRGLFQDVDSSYGTVVQRPAFREMWKIDHTKILHDRFRDYMDAVIANVQPTGRE